MRLQGYHEYNEWSYVGEEHQWLWEIDDDDDHNAKGFLQSIY